MYKFIDYHPDLKLAPDQVRQFADEARSGKRDQYDVRLLDIFSSPQGGFYCYLEAPGEEAVRKHHALSGVTCNDVKQVESLIESRTTRLI